MLCRCDDIYWLARQLYEIDLDVRHLDDEALLIRAEVAEHLTQERLVCCICALQQRTPWNSDGVTLFLDRVDLVEVRLVVPVRVGCPQDGSASQITTVLAEGEDHDLADIQVYIFCLSAWPDGCLRDLLWPTIVVIHDLLDGGGWPRSQLLQHGVLPGVRAFCVGTPLTILVDLLNHREAILVELEDILKAVDEWSAHALRQVLPNELCNQQIQWVVAIGLHKELSAQDWSLHNPHTNIHTCVSHHARIRLLTLEGAGEFRDILPNLHWLTGAEFVVQLWTRNVSQCSLASYIGSTALDLTCGSA